MLLGGGTKRRQQGDIETATTSRGDKHDLGFGLKHGAKLPAEVFMHVTRQRVQILEHKHELSPKLVGCLQNGGAGVIV